MEDTKNGNKPLEYFARNSELGVAEELFLTNKVLDHLGVGYIEFFIKENRIHISASFKDLLGYKEHELSNELRIMETLIHKNDLPSVLLNISDFFKFNGKIPFNLLIRHYHKSGKTKLLQTKGEIITRDEMDAPLRMILTFQEASIDFDDHFRISETQKFKESFQNDIGHELITSLTTILGFSELLKDSDLDEIQKEHLKNLRLATDNLDWLINDLLEFSIPSKDEIVLENYPMNLLDTINYGADIAQRTFTQEKIQIKTSILSDLPEIVIGDSKHLLKLIINLFRNTVEFRQSVKIELEVKSSNDTDKGTNVKFIFRFIGSGEDAINIRKVFKTFNDDNLNGGTLRGKGRGLNYAKKVVEAHGSFSSVRIFENGIAEYSFVLPYLISSELAVPMHISDNFKVESQSLKGIKILLVEDDEMSMMLAQKHLLSHGATVELAKNGKDCLRLAKSNVYDLILMDIIMTEMDGIETTRRIREDLNINTPIFALTAKSSINNRTECLRAGMNNFISKPFTAKTLVIRIMQALDIKLSMDQFKRVPHKIEEEKFCFSNVSNRLEELRQSEGSEFLDVLIKIFHKNILEDNEELKGYLKNKKYDEIGNTAHKMAGSLVVMKFISEYNLALKICANVKSNNTEEIESNCLLLLKAIDNLVSHTIRYI